MLTSMSQALAVAPADHVEITVEEFRGAHVHYSGRELEDVGESRAFGGSVRARVNGAWGFCAFNDVERLDHHVGRACEQARLTASRPTCWPAATAHQAQVDHRLGADPAAVPLADKVALCRGYNDILLAPRAIQTSRCAYRDGAQTLWLATSEGVRIEQLRTSSGLMVAATAKDGTNVQQACKSVGDLRGFENVLGMEPVCERVAERAVRLLSAEPVAGGRYTVVMDPQLAGVFAHEAFGHLSEADFLYENADLLDLMVLGERFGPDGLCIVDDGTLPGEAGTAAYDSEGTPTQRTYLIRDGVLTGRLHSRETAAQMGEEPTGNARAITYRHEPLVRMTNTFIEPRDLPFEQMLAPIDRGIYAVGTRGGQTNMEMFTFAAEEAFEITAGRLGRPLRDVTLTGNVFETLAHVDGIGDDLRLFGGLGGCGKAGQSPLPVADGGPHVRVRDVVVGGCG